MSGIDEEKTMKNIIRLLAVNSELPLVVDSSKIEVVEKFLRLYPGRALVNSVSGDKNRLKKMLDIVAKYGAMFILLPLSQKEVPQTFEKRREIIKYVFQYAQKFGFSKDDIVVDGLVMAVSSNPDSALETLKTVSWCSTIFKTNTIQINAIFLICIYQNLFIKFGYLI